MSELRTAPAVAPLRWRRAAIALAAALAVLLAPGAVAADGATRFQASYDGTFEVAGAVLTFEGTGRATGLGRSTVEGASVLLPTLPTADCPLPKVALALVLDEVTLTAASGDRLRFRNAGTDCLDPATGEIVADATYTVLGGTGRFEGATGRGTVTVVAQCASQLCTGGTFRDLTFDGTLA